jgi:mannose-6-phosphate isomerase
MTGEFMEKIAAPLLLETQYRDYVWGGSRLIPGKSPIAEAWVIFENDLIQNGPLAGKSLGQAVAFAGPALLGPQVYAKTGDRFPLLIKLLDCASWLSLQVHPNDEMAVRLEGPGQYGKTEAWHFLETDPGAEILAGLKPGTSCQTLEKGITKHKVLDLMERLSVKNGDSILINPGMIHALGPGMLVYEVQQTSDWTYRVWDWDRPASPQRQLHIEKSLAVSNPALTGTLIPTQPAPDGSQRLLVSCSYFDLSLLAAEKQPIQLDTRGETFHALTVITGSAHLEGRHWQQPLTRFQSVLVPADAGAYTLVPDGPCQVLKASDGTGGR